MPTEWQAAHSKLFWIKSQAQIRLPQLPVHIVKEAEYPAHPIVRVGTQIFVKEGKEGEEELWEICFHCLLY